MFTNLDELKAFILWAKQQKVQEFRIGEFHIHLSQIALLEASEVESLKKAYIPSTEEPETPEDYQDILFHSVKE